MARLVNRNRVPYFKPDADHDRAVDNPSSFQAGKNRIARSRYNRRNPSMFFDESSSQRLLLLPLFILLAAGCARQNGETDTELLKDPFEWRVQAETLPATLLAGAGIGQLNGNMIVVGGRLPLPDGSFELSDRVAVFDIEKRALSPSASSLRLPGRSAFDAALSTDHGVFLAGGENADGSYSVKVVRINGDGDAGWTVEQLPDLPEARAMTGLAHHDGVLYIGGGLTKASDGQPETALLALKYDDKSADWVRLDPWPGAGKTNPLMAVQFFGDGDAIYVMGGMAANGEHSQTVYEYRIKKASWSQRAAAPVGLADCGIVPFGAAHIFALPGASPTAAAGGYPLLAFHTVTNTWTRTVPTPLQDLPTALFPGDMSLTAAISSATGMTITTADLPVASQRLHIVDYSILVLYFVVLIWMGYSFSKNEKTTNDFFRGGKRLPGWAAGISILGTRFSSISFMAYPAKTFATNWMYLINQFGYMLTAWFVVRYVISFFMRLDVTTAYEYLEMRFGIVVRTIGSVKFVLFDIFRMGVIVLLPSMLLTVITGIDIYLCIIIIGVISTIYTYLGGIEAVIWTDVIQLGIMLFGTLWAMSIAFSGAEGNFIEVLQSASAQGKTKVFDFSFDFTIVTVWVFLLALPGSPNEAVSAQYIVQRFISTKDLKNAATSMYINSFAGPACIFIFFLIGTGMFMFYQANPAQLNPAMRQPDEILAWFVVQQLPVGISGLMIGAIFAATMSSLDSALSSTGTVFVTDIYRRFKRDISDQQALRMAKHLTLLLGVVGTSSALILAIFEIRSLIDYMLQLLFLLGGGLAGIFYLGIFTTRANTPGVVIGYIFSASTLGYCKFYTDLNFFAYNGIGVIACVVAGYLASFLFPPVDKSLEGFTIHTLESR